MRNVIKHICFYLKSFREFEPTAIEMVSGSTEPPKLLTEADLIALMDKNGIGRIILLLSTFGSF